MYRIYLKKFPHETIVTKNKRILGYVQEVNLELSNDLLEYNDFNFTRKTSFKIKNGSMQYHNIYDFLLEFNSDGTKLNIKYNNDGKYIKLFSKKDFIDKCINFKSSTKNIINTFMINGYSFFED